MTHWRTWIAGFLSFCRHLFLGDGTQRRGEGASGATRDATPEGSGVAGGEQGLARFVALDVTNLHSASTAPAPGGEPVTGQPRPSDAPEDIARLDGNAEGDGATSTRQQQKSTSLAGEARSEHAPRGEPFGQATVAAGAELPGAELRSSAPSPPAPRLDAPEETPVSEGATRGRQEDSGDAAEPRLWRESHYRPEQSPGATDVAANLVAETESRITSIASLEESTQAAARPTPGIPATALHAPRLVSSSRRIAPEKRGGRPRGTGPMGNDVPRGRAMGAHDSASSRSPRPELVCWKEGMAWRVGAEVPEELANQEPRVLQSDGEELDEDHLHDLRWPLTDPLGPVVVESCDQAGARDERGFEPNEYRIFKITKAGDNGRVVSRVTRGHYIVIAPRAFVRAEWAGARPLVAPENVIPEAAGLLAHHLLAGEDGHFVLRKDGGGPSVEIRPSTSTPYELFGHEIEDAHSAAGTLFGREPPRLRMDRAAAPVQVVVGVEGPSPRGRRPRLTAASFDEVRSWFDQHEPGWFFVRLYDADGDLLDSLDFRYARGLEAIEIGEYLPLPHPEGHRPVRVRFRLGPYLTLSLVEGPKEIASLGSVPPEGLEFPARPDAGRAILCLRAVTGGEVEVGVSVCRVWWAITFEGEGGEPLAWTDRPQRLSTDDLQPTSSKRLSVLLPAPGWAHAVLVGFRSGFPRRLPVLRSERVAHYPLRNLREDMALRRDGRCELLISVQTGATQYGPVTVAEVQAGRDVSRELEKHRTLDLSSLSAPRLMSVITRGNRFISADRRTVHRLRRMYYARARKGDLVATSEFLLEGLALVAALLQRGRSLRLPSRWRRRAESLAELEPAAVAEWQRHLRQAEVSARLGAGGPSRIRSTRG